jgi:uncharacterized protein involved in response to NO
LSAIPPPIIRSHQVILALGFRPFFLFAGLSAVASLALWLAMLRGWMPMNGYYAGTTWHAHELLFGYATAAIAGFLLTATRNWTGLATASGVQLAGLVLLWLAGRIAPFLPLPGVLVAAVDLSFPAAVAVSLFAPLWRGPNPANRVFIVLLGSMSLASLLVHVEALGMASQTALAADRLMLGLILLTLLVVAGRIMPFFTQTACPGSSPSSYLRVERLAFVLAVLWVATDAASQTGLAVAVPVALFALGLALVQGLRLAGWHDRRVWGIPLLAVLYSGYLWLIIGLVLNALTQLGLLAPFPSLHALTIGAVGVFTLGMMARITLGHTGRAMVASPMTVSAFALLNLAAVVRVFAPLLWPAAYLHWLTLSGVLWLLAFGLFLWVHVPMLISPRVDGRPG